MQVAAHSFNLQHTYKLQYAHAPCGMLMRLVACSWTLWNTHATCGMLMQLMACSCNLWNAHATCGMLNLWNAHATCGMLMQLVACSHILQHAITTCSMLPQILACSHNLWHSRTTCGTWGPFTQRTLTTNSGMLLQNQENLLIILSNKSTSDCIIISLGPIFTIFSIPVTNDTVDKSHDFGCHGNNFGGNLYVTILTRLLY